MTSLITAAEVTRFAWFAASWSFLIAVFGGGALVSKARARGRRLFRDEPPLARVRALRYDTTHAHEQDAV